MPSLPGSTRHRAKGGRRPSALRARSAGHRRSRRRRATAWVLALVVAAGVHNAVASADSARRDWSEVRTVLVLRDTVEADDPVGDDDVEQRPVPAAAVPDDSLASLPDGAEAAVALRPGTVLARSLLTDRSGDRSARSLPAGRVALVVNTGELPHLAVRGDVVDVIAPGWDDPVAVAATVVEVTGDGTTLAIRESDATPTATASLSGPVALVVRP